MNSIKSLIIKKQNGESELITSIFTILTLVIVMIFFIDYYSDIKLKDSLDQVAREYILTLETTNKLDEEALFNDIREASKGREWEEGNVTVKVILNDNIGTPAVNITKNIDNLDPSELDIIEIKSKYGDKVTLIITGNIALSTTRWDSPYSRSNSEYSTYLVRKSSIFKH